MTQIKISSHYSIGIDHYLKRITIYYSLIRKSCIVCRESIQLQILFSAIREVKTKICQLTFSTIRKPINTNIFNKPFISLI